MATAGGFVQGYNAQAVVNEEQVIVAAEVTDECNDAHQLHPMIKATQDSLADAGLEEQPDTLLADAGYANEENIEALDDDDPDCYIATRNMKHNPAPVLAPVDRCARTPRRSRRWTARFRTRPDVSSTDVDSRSSSQSSDRSRRPVDPPLHAPGQVGSRVGVEADRRHTQPAQALPPRSCRPRRRALQPDSGAQPPNHPPGQPRSTPPAPHPDHARSAPTHARRDNFMQQAARTA